MSIASTSKLKFPENFHKEVERLIATKDNITLMKQMQNLKLNKYSKYIVNENKNNDVINKLKNSNKALIIPSGKDKNNKMECKSMRRKKDILDNNSTRNRRFSKEPDDDNLPMDDSVASIVKGALRKESTTENSQYTTNSTSTNHNNYYSHPNNNLEVIFELETQRTETVNDTAHKSPNKSQRSNLNLNNSCDHFAGNSEINHLNPQYSSDYMMDIYQNLLLEEINMKSSYGYMNRQNDINEKMRAILIDWIIDVHLKFKLTAETLFLGVHLIDRYLSEVNIKREKLQLIGVAALLIACKYEEIFSPELRDFEYITDKAYRKEQITEIEIEMLKLFQFSITVPSCYRFYEIISSKMKFTPQEFASGRYLLELFLIDYRYTKYLPSQIALSACFLVINFFSTEKNIRSCFCLKEFLELELSQDYNFISYESILKDCCRDICFILENIENTQLLTVKKKFMTAEHYRVSRFTRKIGIN